LPKIGEGKPLPASEQPRGYLPQRVTLTRTPPAPFPGGAFFLPGVTYPVLLGGERNRGKVKRYAAWWYSGMGKPEKTRPRANLEAVYNPAQFVEKCKNANKITVFVKTCAGEQFSGMDWPNENIKKIRGFYG